MDEDEEEFYDSLDEDYNVEDVHQIIKIDSEIELKNKESEYILSESECSVKKKVPIEIAPPKTTKIPLYVGETYKEDLKINLKPNPNVNAGKTSSSCISCETGNKSNKIKSENVSKKKLDSSYWTIYCQKNGISCDDDTQNTDSDKSTQECSTNRTFSTFISGCCLNGNTWDAPSMFEKYIPKTYANQKIDFMPTFQEQISGRSSYVTKCESSSTEVFRSVSQINIRQTPVSRTPSKCRSNTSSVSTRPLSLKNMGPNETKLELIKKQQEYGLRASTINRAKIIQNLSKMKQVIKERRQKKNDTR